MRMPAADQQQRGGRPDRGIAIPFYIHPRFIARGSAIRKLCALTGLQHDIASQ
jgi:hypothetical protein